VLPDGEEDAELLEVDHHILTMLNSTKT